MRQVGNRVFRDARFAVRLLMRDRGFAATAILLLGLGIGVNNVMFTVIYGHTLRKLPIRDPDRVLYVSAFTDQVPDGQLSYPEFEDLRHASRVTNFAAYGTASATLAEDGHAPERVEAAYVTSNAFETIGRTLVLGRMFSAREDTAGAPRIALLSSALWRSRYGGESILGRTVFLNGAAATVVGVVPDRSGFPSTAQIWMPLAHMPGLARDQRSVTNLRVFGRVREGVAVADARAEIETIIVRVPQQPEAGDRRRARVVPISQRFLGRATEPAWLAFMGVGSSCCSCPARMSPTCCWRAPRGAGARSQSGFRSARRAAASPVNC